MPLVIDCYNVLHADPRHELTTASLCRKLAQTRWARHGITVVCDGRPKPNELVDVPPQVRVVHSGAGRSADDIIIAQIKASANPRRLVVVSSDNAIRAAARRRRANAWSSEEFIRKLAEQLRQAAGAADARPDKPTDVQLTDEQVDGWLRTFGFDREPGDDDPWPPW